MGQHQLQQQGHDRPAVEEERPPVDAAVPGLDRVEEDRRAAISGEILREIYVCEISERSESIVFRFVTEGEEGREGAETFSLQLLDVREFLFQSSGGASARPPHLRYCCFRGTHAQPHAYFFVSPRHASTGAKETRQGIR